MYKAAWLDNQINVLILHLSICDGTLLINIGSITVSSMLAWWGTHSCRLVCNTYTSVNYWKWQEMHMLRKALNIKFNFNPCSAKYSYVYSWLWLLATYPFLCITYMESDLRCWQRFPVHVPVQWHTPGCVQVPPFRQGRLQTAAIK